MSKKSSNEATASTSKTKHVLLVNFGTKKGTKRNPGNGEPKYKAGSKIDLTDEQVLTFRNLKYIK